MYPIINYICIYIVDKTKIIHRNCEKRLQLFEAILIKN